MIWDGWLDFLAMGGYGLYVWGSYAVALALVLSELALLLLRKRTILGHLGWNDDGLKITPPKERRAHGASPVASP